MAPTPYYPPSGSSYPYSAYHPPAANGYTPQAGAYQPQAAGATPYPASAYQTPYPTAGYGAWTYPYSYYPHTQHTQQPAQTTQQQARPATTTPAAKPAAATSKPSTPAPTTPAYSATTPAFSAAGSTTQQYSTQAAPLTTTMQSVPQRPLAYTSSYTYVPTYRDTLAASSGNYSRGVGGGGKKSTFRGLFTKELRNLMFSFGDDRNPSNDTVNVMEEILVEYIVDVCQTALAPGKKSRLSIEDLRRALSHPADANKLARLEELLFMQEVIKRARSQFDETDMHKGAYQP